MRRLERDGNGGNLTAARIEREYATHAAAAVSMSRLGSVANSADRSAWCTFAGNGFGGEHVMIEFKGSHFERDVILWTVR